MTNTSGNSSQVLSYQYDAAGNVTNDGQASFKYDAESRLAVINEGSPQQATYSYDSANRRVKKVHQGNTTFYIWEGSQVIAEYGGALDEGGGAVRYTLADRLSTRAVLDGSGSVKGTQDHLAYGEDSASSGEVEKHRFTSYEKDSESGLDYAVNRHYSSDTGRFRQVDPVAGNVFRPQRLNRYIYVRNDPVNRTDRLGLQDEGDEGPAIILEANACADLGLAYNEETGECYGLDIWEIPVPFGFFGGPIQGVGSGVVGGAEPMPPAQNLSFEVCSLTLESDLARANLSELGLADTARSPSRRQFRMARRASRQTGADLSLILATQLIESRFLEPARNSAVAFGPLQVTRNIPGSLLGEFTWADVLGSPGPLFTGNVRANVIVGARYLNYLTGIAGGDLARAGTAYLGPNYALNTDPSQYTGRYRTRYEAYRRILPVFEFFVECVELRRRQ